MEGDPEMEMELREKWRQGGVVLENFLQTEDEFQSQRTRCLPNTVKENRFTLRHTQDTGAQNLPERKNSVSRKDWGTQWHWTSQQKLENNGTSLQNSEKNISNLEFYT